jgi:hypothetical protein
LTERAELQGRPAQAEARSIGSGQPTFELASIEVRHLFDRTSRAMARQMRGCHSDNHRPLSHAVVPT